MAYTVLMTLRIQENIPLRLHTTLKIGGPAAYFVDVVTVEELKAAVVFAEQKQLPLLLLGGGSNLLIGDAGFSGLVIKLGLSGRTYKEDGDRVLLTVGAGEELDEVVAEAVSRGLWGIENLSAIPGSVGATPVQNVGAYGVEVKDVITEVSALHVPTKNLRTFSSEECEFGYRDSFFKTEEGKKYIITSVTFLLQKNAQLKILYADLKNFFSNHSPTISDVRAAVIKIRQEKFPDWRTVGTAGSFFKNPIITNEAATLLTARYPELPLHLVSATEKKVPLGYVLDKVFNYKGFRSGNVGLSDTQALVLINYGGASSEEVIAFSEAIKKAVLEKTNLKIECEVTFI